MKESIKGEERVTTNVKNERYVSNGREVQNPNLYNVEQTVKTFK